MRIHQREVSALYQLNQVMISSVELKILFDRVLQTIVETLVCDHVVSALHTRRKHLEVAGIAGLDTEHRECQLHLDQGITGEQEKACGRSTSRMSTKISAISVTMDRSPCGVHSFPSPWWSKERLIGVLNLHKKETNAFPSSELKMIQAIANQMAIAIENGRLIEKARDSATSTRLPAWPIAATSRRFSNAKSPRPGVSTPSFPW